MKTKGLIICALFAAIIAISAPLCIPLGTVTVTLALFSIALTAFFSGSKNAVISTAIYIAVGLSGLPVFSGFQGGVSAAVSPTGGFILSYVFVAAILGKAAKTKKKSRIVFLCAVALAICYVCGACWYMLVTKAGIVTALTVCVLPFVVFDVIKLYMAYIVAQAIKKRV